MNASDPMCPSTAPNKLNRTQPDIGKELTGGCYGFATKLMHWPEDLIVGGAVKNRSGRILKAKALQSIVQLMAEQDMFEYWQNHYKVHNIEWSIDKAKQVLEAWQRKFAEVRFFNASLNRIANRIVHCCRSYRSSTTIASTHESCRRNCAATCCTSSRPRA